MPSISDTIARLSALKGRSGQLHRIGGPDRLSDLEGFGSNPGRLRARTFLPPGLKPGAPLVVVLHGCTQNAAGYDNGSGWSRLSERLGFALLFPEQSRENNPNLCFNWFLPADIQRDSGEVMSIAQMVDTLVGRERLDADRVFITGLSAGGAMTAAMLATYPEKFAGGAVIAGLPYSCATSIPEAFERMRGQGLPQDRALEEAVSHASPHDGPWPRLSVWHGDADHTVSPVNADAIITQWSGLLGVAGRGETETLGTHRRELWRDAAGREVIEHFRLAGMGHGTPLDPRSDGAVAGPYMLDIGISSTIRTAQFWGIADRTLAEVGCEDINLPAPRNRMPSHQAMPPAPPEIRWPHASAAGPGRTGGSIQQTIEAALRAAGLMR
jgi:poly(hydroxyalkanoate) depolymerase family esterase